MAGDKIACPTSRTSVATISDRYRSASDDAMALIMALRACDAQVLAITTVAGNVPVMRATQNDYASLNSAAATSWCTQGAASHYAASL
jgi:hypothetical protein